MPNANFTGLLDPDAAQQVIIEAVPLLGQGIAEEARVRAEAVRRFLEERGRLRRDKFETGKFVDDVIRCLEGRWLNIYQAFFPHGDPRLRIFNDALLPVRQEYQRLEWKNSAKVDPEGYGQGQRMFSQFSAGEVRSLLQELHRRLITLADSLTRSAPRPAARSAPHPPNHARLRGEAIAGAVEEELATLIDEGIRHYETAQAGGWPDSSQASELRYHEWESRSRVWSDWSWRFAHPLDAFLTKDVRERYITATPGFAVVEGLAGGRLSGHYVFGNTSQAYRETVARVAPRIYSAYFAIAVNYLDEVLELMPDYAEQSGQG